VRFIFLSLCIVNFSFSQEFAAPNVEDVFGGNVLSITGYALSSDSSRFFAATESANSIFYTDAKSLATSASSFKKWKVIPSLAATENVGVIDYMAVHKASGKLFYVANQSLYVTSTSATANVVVENK
jgi:hypothetical protein